MLTSTSVHRRRKSNIEMVFEYLMLLIIFTFMGGLELMVAVALIHQQWIPQLPTIGYWWAVLIVLLLKGTFSKLPKVERYRERGPKS